MKLYVIGNGFDRAHGIESGYDDFEKFMSSRYGYEMNLIGPLFDNSRIDLWADFENALGQIDPNTVVWSVEAEARINEPEELGRQSNFMVDTVAQACDTLQGVFESCFAEWIEKIDITDTEAFLAMDSHARYLTFNYTETLEEVYGIPECQVLHIHNCRRDAAPIVGHGSSECIPFTGGDWIATDEISDSIRHIFSTTRKDVKRYIRENEPFFRSLGNIDEVYVYGHSLNDIDLPYFQEIVKHIDPGASWTVSYYDNAERKKFEDRLYNILHISTARVRMVTLDDPSLHLL